MNMFKTLSILYFVYLFPQKQAFLDNSFQKCSLTYRDFHISKFCAKEIQDGLKCLTKYNYASTDSMDTTIRVVFNVQVLVKYIQLYCSQMRKVNNTSCQQSSDNLVKIKPNCPKNGYRINFLNYESCSVYTGIVTSKLLLNILSFYCQETDINRGLIPPYGPHLKCYSLKFMDNKNHNNILKNQLLYCKNFNYSKIKKCTIDSISSVSSNEYIYGKYQFQENALKFLNKVKYFCENLSKIPEDVITSCLKKDFDNCKTNAHKLISKPNSTYSPGTYLDCISEIYSKCQPDLGDLVKAIQLNVQESAASNLPITSCLLLFVIYMFVAAAI